MRSNRYCMCSRYLLTVHICLDTLHEVPLRPVPTLLWCGFFFCLLSTHIHTHTQRSVEGWGNTAVEMQETGAEAGTQGSTLFASEQALCTARKYWKYWGDFQVYNNMGRGHPDPPPVHIESSASSFPLNLPRGAAGFPTPTTWGAGPECRCSAGRGRLSVAADGKRSPPSPAAPRPPSHSAATSAVASVTARRGRCGPGSLPPRGPDPLKKVPPPRPAPPGPNFWQDFCGSHKENTLIKHQPAPSFPLLLSMRWKKSGLPKESLCTPGSETTAVGWANATRSCQKWITKRPKLWIMKL